MSACPQWLQLLVEYADESCPPELTRQVEQHLLTCKRCAEAVAAQRQVQRALKDLPRHRAPEHLSRRIRDRFRAAQRIQRVDWRWQVVAAACTLVAGVALWCQTSPPVSQIDESEASVAQVVVQEYVDALSNDAFLDPSLQALRREASLKPLQRE